MVTLDDLGGDGETGENDLARAERVVGGQGPDRLKGQAGVGNRLEGGPGNDLLDVRDDPDVRDEVFCGAGSDVALTDDVDTASDDCEDARTVEVERERVVAAKRALQSPSVGLLTYRGTVRTRILRLRVRCYAVTNQRCRIQLGAAASVGRSMRSLGSSRFTIVSGASRTIRLRVNRPALALIRRGGRQGARLRVTLRSSDATGHVNRRTLRLRVRAPR